MSKKTLLIIEVSALVLAVAGGVFLIKRIADKSKPSSVIMHEVSFDTNGGSELLSIKVEHGKTMQKPRNPVRDGYVVSDWLYNEHSWSFEIDTVNEDMTLVTKWDTVTYSISYNLNGGSYDGEYINEYTVEDTFDLIFPTKSGSVFAGWFDENGNLVESIREGMTGDLVLTARWVENIEALSTDTDKGNVRVYVSEDDENVVSVLSVPVDNKYHLFEGWYSEDGDFISDSNPYTFELKDGIVNKIYSKYISDEEELEWDLEHAVNPVEDASNTGHILYGLYPQTVVDDNNIIEQLNVSGLTKFNNCVCYNHEYYMRRTAIHYRSEETEEKLPFYRFDNGKDIIEGKNYWFKVEPIYWRLLKASDSNNLLATDKLLEPIVFSKTFYTRIIDEKTVYPSNYKHSYIREWLNGGFYDYAFQFNNSPIMSTPVDNSAQTTKNGYKEFECENTNDKVFLLSYSDYLNASYGFAINNNSHPSRKFLTTDYSRSCGALFSTKANSLFYGYAWTRSPYSDESLKDKPEYLGTQVSRIHQDGGLNYSDNEADYCCCQPALTIKAFYRL